MSKTRLIFGCGYIGLRVARQWQAAGDTVHVVTRTKGRADSLAAEGLRPLIADVTQPDTLAQLPAGDTLLFAIGYDRKAGPSIHEVYAEGLRRVLDAIPASYERVIYTSTTGVYGPAEGAWVDEQTPPNPQRDGGRASLAAEQLLAESNWSNRSVALRLAGLYGPDRLPYLRQLQSGEPIAAVRSGWLNLIHADDAAGAIAHTAEAEAPPQLVCVSDGNPPIREAYYQEVARLLGAPAPQFVEPEAGSPRAARAAADKRVGNRLLVESLGYKLRYRSYAEGLASFLPPSQG